MRGVIVLPNGPAALSLRSGVIYFGPLRKNEAGGTEREENGAARGVLWKHRALHIGLVRGLGCLHELVSKTQFYPKTEG